MNDKFKQPIKLVNAWHCENSLLINPDKTKVLAVGVSQVPRRDCHHSGKHSLTTKYQSCPLLKI